MYGMSEQGTGRKVNQDHFYCNKSEQEDKKITALFVVADGVGGRSCGSEASSMASDAIQSWWFDNYMDYYDEPEKIKDLMPEVFNQIISNMYDFGDEQNVQMATTLTMLIINHDHYYIFHCGDSRIYRYNEKLYYMTIDDKVVDPRDGRAKLSNCLSNILPEYHLTYDSGKLYDNDVFILATDGAFKKLDENTIKSIMAADTSAEDMCKEMYNAALEAGEQDDITIVAFRLTNSKNEDA